MDSSKSGERKNKTAWYGLNYVFLKDILKPSSPVPMKMTWYEEGLCRCIQVKTRSYWNKTGPQSNMEVGETLLEFRWALDHFGGDTQRQRQRENANVKAKAETGVSTSQTISRIASDTRSKRKEWKRFYPRAFRERMTLWTPWFWLLASRMMKQYISVFFRPPSLS